MGRVGGDLREVEPNACQAKLSDESTGEDGLVFAEPVAQGPCELVDPTSGGCVGEDDNRRVVGGVVRVVERTVALDADIRLGMLLVSAGSEQHGRSVGLDLRRKLGAGLIEQRTKLERQPVGKPEIQ